MVYALSTPGNSRHTFKMHHRLVQFKERAEVLPWVINVNWVIRKLDSSVEAIANLRIRASKTKYRKCFLCAYRCCCVAIFVYPQYHNHSTWCEACVAVNCEKKVIQALSLLYGSRQSRNAIDTGLSSGFAAAGSADGAAVNAGTDCAAPAYTLSTAGLHLVYTIQQ